MKFTTVAILVVCALLIGLMLGAGGGLVVASLYQGQQESWIDPPTARGVVSVLVPNANLPQGMVLDNPEVQFSYRTFPAQNPPLGAIVNYEDLRGKQLARALAAGTPCTLADLRTPATIAQALPEGKRAMTVKIKNDVASSFLVPGSRVDLIGMVADPDNPPKLIAKVIVQDVVVLATAVVAGAPQSVLTVAIDPDDAVKLAGVTGEFTPVLLKANNAVVDKP